MNTVEVPPKRFDEKVYETWLQAKPNQHVRQVPWKLRKRLLLEWVSAVVAFSTSTFITFTRVVLRSNEALEQYFQLKVVLLTAIY